MARRLPVIDAWSEKVFEFNERGERATDARQLPLEFLFIRLDPAPFDSRGGPVWPQVEPDAGGPGAVHRHLCSEAETVYGVRYFGTAPKTVVLHWPLPDGVYTMRLKAVDGE
jgi:hypothetical protein